MASGTGGIRLTSSMYGSWPSVTTVGRPANAFEAEHPLPQAGVLGLGMSHEKLIALHRDVTEDDVAGPFENADVAIGRAEPCSLDFGKIAKPSKSRRADRLPFRINDEMRGLIVVAVDSLAHAQTGLLHEADRADRDGVHELLRGGDHLDVDLVIGSHGADAHGIASRF
jgi:hypothetical protein